jgi:hypothetical protein
LSSSSSSSSSLSLPRPLPLPLFPPSAATSSERELEAGPAEPWMAAQRPAWLAIRSSKRRKIWGQRSAMKASCPAEPNGKAVETAHQQQVVYRYLHLAQL